MAQLLGSNPDELREKIQRRIVQLEKGGQTEADFVRPRSIYVKNPTAPIKTVDRDWRNAYLRDYNYRVYQAVELKRNARLREADWIYSNIFEQEEKLDKEYVWAWCKIMILAKRFLDLDLLLRYLHALNARENILSAAIGDDFSDYRAYGSEPVMDFQYNAAKCLRDRCDEPLRTKKEVESRFMDFGGSEYWYHHYSLSDAEYAEFEKYFGAHLLSERSTKCSDSAYKAKKDAKAKANSDAAQKASGPGTSSSSGRSGGCYVATAVYGSYDCKQVCVLRRFRDFKLAHSKPGRLFVKAYYAVSPWLVKHFGHVEFLKKAGKNALDPLVAHLRKKGYDDAPYAGR